MSVTTSQEASSLKHKRNSVLNEENTIQKGLVSWKRILRKQQYGAIRPVTKHIFKLPESSKTKNIPKNISKAIIQLILQSDIIFQAGCIQNKEFTEFVNKNKQIDNLSTLLRLCSNHKNPKLNEMHQIFRRITWYFLRKLYVPYVFNSKIKEPAHHIQYRYQLLKLVQNL